ncbi:hypothetical protein PVAP13_5NG236500 [Panicum virgatum]|uniref:Legumain prodomain domain-containing protein n=1 Tax=Panicum virgatum TaxID=38727 RepID=A0A8T0RWF5_PANVG|nr:hypothetical protein PVAP13_5NG236500 [Panicum virgatum]
MMAARLRVALLLSVCLCTARARPSLEPTIRLPSERAAAGAAEEGTDDAVGTRWAVLIAGSNGYYNYRHQADICHAYQIMKKGGLKDENIIVFMYDDIAHSPENPRPGVIINHPQGGDVYAGVPKDYTGREVNVNNFFAVLLGNKTAVSGGSGKVVDSGPNDHIFVYYSDHGGPGVLGMPTYPYLYGDDLVNVLKKKHAAGTYKSLVFYLEACESGSIFEGLLPNDINVYATTASNADESSWGTYCPGEHPSPPPEYDTCLGDLYSIAWMEDSDFHNLRTESLKQQYNLVKDRTSAHNTYTYGSHRDADLVYFWQKYRKLAEGSPGKNDARKELLEVMAHRSHVDNSVELIGSLLFGSEDGPRVLKAVRAAGEPLVDDWSCLKSMVRAFEAQCGSLAQYGMKHMRSFANICNAGILPEAVLKVAAQACTSIPSNPWSSIHKGISA